jgi:hypothetical protein
MATRVNQRKPIKWAHIPCKKTADFKVGDFHPYTITYHPIDPCPGIGGITVATDTVVEISARTTTEAIRKFHQKYTGEIKKISAPMVQKAAR